MHNLDNPFICCFLAELKTCTPAQDRLKRLQHNLLKSQKDKDLQPNRQNGQHKPEKQKPEQAATSLGKEEPTRALAAIEIKEEPTTAVVESESEVMEPAQSPRRLSQRRAAAEANAKNAALFKPADKPHEQHSNKEKPIAPERPQRKSLSPRGRVKQQLNAIDNCTSAMPSCSNVGNKSLTPKSTRRSRSRSRTPTRSRSRTRSRTHSKSPKRHVATPAAKHAAKHAVH